MIWLHARKARGASRAASPVVFGKLRERTKRPLERDALRRIIIHVFRGDDFVGRFLVFDPLIESSENVVRGVGRVRTVAPERLTERICTGSAKAVTHSRDHEETIEVPGVFVAAHFLDHSRCVTLASR
jgi:hypothetical protein